jgi:phosphonate transport system substrate-binding protein
MWKPILVRLAVAVALTLSLAACKKEDTPRATEAPTTLVMGLIPAENNQTIAQTFEPMRAHLEKKLGIPVKVFTATDYAGVIEAMRSKHVDVAFFGPLSYYLAEQEAGAEAFAVGVLQSTGKSDYHSCLVVPGDSPVKTIADLKGKKAAFVDPASTSGGLMPSYMIKQATGLMPEEFFSNLVWAGSHDAAELAVKNKTVDVAADNDITYPKMIKAGQITEQTNRILVTSPALPGSPLTYRSDLPAELKAKIRDAILTAHNEIKVAGYGELIRYDPAAPKDYQVVRDLVKELKLKKEQLSKK